MTERELCLLCWRNFGRSFLLRAQRPTRLPLPRQVVCSHPVLHPTGNHAKLIFTLSLPSPKITWKLTLLFKAKAKWRMRLEYSIKDSQDYHVNILWKQVCKDSLNFYFYFLVMTNHYCHIRIIITTALANITKIQSVFRNIALWIMVLLQLHDCRKEKKKKKRQELWKLCSNLPDNGMQNMAEKLEKTSTI